MGIGSLLVVVFGTMAWKPLALKGLHVLRCLGMLRSTRMSGGVEVVLCSDLAAAKLLLSLGKMMTSSRASSNSFSPVQCNDVTRDVTILSRRHVLT